LVRRWGLVAYRRAPPTTQRALIEHYGSNLTNEFAELFI
jgi:hypothetical protein